MRDCKRQGVGRVGQGLGRASQHTVVVALPGRDVQRRVPMVVDGMQVAACIQEDLGDGGAASEGGPMQADILLLGVGAGGQVVGGWSSPEGLELSPAFPAPMTATHIVSEGDVSTPCQQHADHFNVLVFCGPDDGRPPAAVLWAGGG